MPSTGTGWSRRTVSACERPHGVPESSWHRVVLDCCWFLAWAIGSSAWCLTAAGQLGATFDEPIYVQEGLQVWRTGSHHGLMKLGTMPLPVDVITLPLHLRELQQHTHFNTDADLARLLPLARAGTLVFWWLLLFYTRMAAGRLGGPWAGRLALAWIAFEPNFLAHASLATTDIAVTACLLALVYHFRAGRDGGWFRRLAVPAFWFGAAVLAKASGLVFGALCLFAVEIESLARMGAWQARSSYGAWIAFASTGAGCGDSGAIVAGSSAEAFCSSFFSSAPTGRCSAPS